MDHLKNTHKKEKIKETGYSQSIYQKKLDKACFQQDITNGYFKDLTGRTSSDKILCNKAFDIANDPKYDEYQSCLASMVSNFFNKKYALLVNKIASVVLLIMKT